ncbi:succinate dehydrogenase cytochrome b subunit [Crocinitomicaceae bacterium]|nr:succinate dehydrogenase cytochrome b subunit [Crocinitomicaceae bacterium]
MSKSVLLKSSIAKKYWMAITGLFLCLFLVGHLLGNLQLFSTGEAGRRAFNEYAYFMQTNPFIKVMSYLTYLSILFHAIDGIMLAVQNKKARPVQYAMNNAKANSSSASRKMAILGSIIFIFIATHMVNFWAKMHFGGLSLHKIELTIPESDQKQELYLTTTGSFISPDQVEVRDGNQFYDKQFGLKLGEGYKDLHSNVMAFFSGKDVHGVEGNKLAWLAVLLYTISMAVLSFHLMHGFAAAFQSLGLRHPRYTNLIANAGKLFSIVVPALFAIIPLYIFFS